MQAAQALASLPTNVQEALAKFQLRERVGVAPQWKPENNNDFLIGRCVGAGSAGDYDGAFMTFDTPDGVQTVWINADLRQKLLRKRHKEEADVDAALREVGHDFIIVFTGWQKKADNPKLKNDMREYFVSEILGPGVDLPKPLVEVVA